MHGLSKSRIMSSLQCLKRVHLEVHRRDLLEYSKATEASFEVGHEVGDMAIRLYGRGRGIEIPYDDKGLSGALVRTDELIRSGFREPIFEATFQHEGVLVREDVLLPSANGESWRIVEVKASTRVKPEYVQDCAIQAWVHKGVGLDFDSISLAHIDNQFEYRGDGNYDGLLTENDLTDDVRSVLPSVPAWVDRAKEAVEGPMPDVAVGAQCTKPYECPFIKHCWPSDTRYPITGLGGGRKKLGLLVLNGYRDIRDVPPSEISGQTQERIHRVTVEGKPELLPGAKAFVSTLPYPRFYLDFETIAPAIPIWPDTRPYQALPIQWSCHIERSESVIEHKEFLDLSGDPPMRKLAEELIQDLEDEGPVLMYTSYEQRVIVGLVEMFPDLAEDLQAIVGRLVDLHPVTKENYYHPDMLGSWSIKAVLPTIAPEMDYELLEGINVGTDASVAYLEAIDPATTVGRREEIRDELLQYCKHDTEAMIRLVHFFFG
jgi:hypothetical protein